MIDNIHKPLVKNPLNKKILVIIEKNFEDLEYWYPKLRLLEAGADVIVAAPAIVEYRGLHGLTAIPDIKIADINEKDYDGIVIPGGYAPDFLRRYEEVLSLVRAFNNNNRLIAFICHAGWVPISAGILRNRSATGLIAIKDDLVNAGANWLDETVVIDGNLISSRRPNDLPCFCNAIVKSLESQK